MSSSVAVIEHIDLTAVFTYRTMSYDIATTLTQKLNLVRCRPTLCVKASSAVIRCRAQCERRLTRGRGLPIYLETAVTALLVQVHVTRGE